MHGEVVIGLSVMRRGRVLIEEGAQAHRTQERSSVVKKVSRLMSLKVRERRWTLAPARSRSRCRRRTGASQGRAAGGSALGPL